MRQVGVNGLHIIQFFESWRASPYDDDQDGNPMTGNLTIGWGHKLVNGDPTEWWQSDYKMTKELGLKVLEKDVKVAIQGVHRLLGPVADRLNQNQFDALVSFVFNLGETQLRGTQTLEIMRAEAHETVPAYIRKWRKDNGAVSNGLIARRAVEAWLYALPVVAPAYDLSAGTVDKQLLSTLEQAPSGTSVVVISPRG